MMRRGFLAGAGASLTRTAEHPNIVLILADDLGWADLGCYGNRFHETPRIDELAREGMRFTNAYAGAPICSPTRAGIVTGQHPARLHLTGQPSYYSDPPVRKLLHPPFRKELPREIPNLAGLLAKSGYACGCFGKWGLGSTPLDYGFQAAADGDAARVAEAAADFIRGNAGRPFFCWVNPNEVHTPLEPKAPAAALARFKARLKPGEAAVKALYAAVVERLDACTGAVLESIEKARPAGRTAVVFTSDNGGFTPVTSNAPLRDGKASLYEGGLRVPLIVRWPGQVRPDSTSDAVVSTTDLFPTLLELAARPAREGAASDGISMLPAWRGARAKPRTLYWHWPHYRRTDPGIHASPSSAIRNGDWKLLHFYEDNHAELYGLAADAGERNDLYRQQRSLAERLRSQLQAWLGAVGAQLAQPNPGYAGAEWGGKGG